MRRGADLDLDLNRFDQLGVARVEGALLVRQAGCPCVLDAEY